MQAANVVLRKQAIQANKPSGGGGGGEEPSPLFLLGGMLLMASLVTLAYGVWGTDTKTPWLVASGVSFGLLLILLAWVFRERIFQAFGDGPLTRAQTAPLELKASAPGTLPLLVVVPPQGCV